MVAEDGSGDVKRKIAKICKYHKVFRLSDRKIDLFYAILMQNI
jgi:hypothetical protein